MKEMQETLHYEIFHDTLNQQFYTEVDGNRAYVSYTVHDNALDIRHTIVPDKIGGRGIASALVKETYQYALIVRLRPMATCAYAVTWLKRHPEYGGIVNDDCAGKSSCAL